MIRYRRAKIGHYGSKTGKRRKSGKIEDLIQESVVRYIRAKYPTVMITISPEGIWNIPIQVGMKLKRMGYTAGTPDIHFLKARNGYHGLYIELKRPEVRDNSGKLIRRKGVVSKEQEAFIKYLNDEGYMAGVCYGVQEACNLIDWYMGFEA